MFSASANRWKSLSGSQHRANQVSLTSTSLSHRISTPTSNGSPLSQSFIGARASRNHASNDRERGLGSRAPNSIQRNIQRYAKGSPGDHPSPPPTNNHGCNQRTPFMRTMALSGNDEGSPNEVELSQLTMSQSQSVSQSSVTSRSQSKTTNPYSHLRHDTANRKDCASYRHRPANDGNLSVADGSSSVCTNSTYMRRSDNGTTQAGRARGSRNGSVGNYRPVGFNLHSTGPSGPFIRSKRNTPTTMFRPSATVQETQKNIETHDPTDDSQSTNSTPRDLREADTNNIVSGLATKQYESIKLRIEDIESERAALKQTMEKVDLLDMERRKKFDEMVEATRRDDAERLKKYEALVESAQKILSRAQDADRASKQGVESIEKAVESGISRSVDAIDKATEESIAKGTEALARTTESNIAKIVAVAKESVSGVAEKTQQLVKISKPLFTECCDGLLDRIIPMLEDPVKVMVDSFLTSRMAKRPTSLAALVRRPEPPKGAKMEAGSLENGVNQASTNSSRQDACGSPAEEKPALQVAVRDSSQNSTRSTKKRARVALAPTRRSKRLKEKIKDSDDAEPKKQETSLGRQTGANGSDNSERSKTLKLTIGSATKLPKKVLLLELPADSPFLHRNEQSDSEKCVKANAIVPVTQSQSTSEPGPLKQYEIESEQSAEQLERVREKKAPAVSHVVDSSNGAVPAVGAKKRNSELTTSKPGKREKAKIISTPKTSPRIVSGAPVDVIVAKFPMNPPSPFREDDVGSYTDNARIVRPKILLGKRRTKKCPPISLSQGSTKKKRGKSYGRKNKRSWGLHFENDDEFAFRPTT